MEARWQRNTNKTVQKHFSVKKIIITLLFQVFNQQENRNHFKDEPGKYAGARKGISDKRR